MSLTLLTTYDSPRVWRSRPWRPPRVRCAVRDAVGRVAMLLALLFKQHGLTRKRDLQIPMTRSDMANYLGLSLEAVVRASRRLEQQGIVEFAGRHQVRILDRKRFEALAANV